MRYRIKNWHEHQHYKDRCPPWIKLHNSMLTSEVWVMGTDQTRTLAIACMLLAARDKANDGSFNGDPEYVKRFGYLNSKPDFKQLIEYGFIDVVQDASNSLAKCNTEERREETETEGEKRRLARGSRLPPDWKLPLEWGNWALQEKQGSTAEDIRRCAERFKDYWISVAGSKGVKADWQATWRTWVRRDTEIGFRPASGLSARQSEVERILGVSKPVELVMKDIEND